MTVNEIYAFLEELAPFKYQDSYDNSGFLIGDKDAEITGVCLCLDITLDVIAEALKKRANLIISHHPVIFKPLSGVKAKTPVHMLIKHEINAICAHTNFDVAFLSDIMLDLLELPQGGEAIEPINADGAGFGRIADLPEAVLADKLALKCKQAFNSSVVRYYDAGKPIRRVGVCSGGGGGAFEKAVNKGCDAFITGEVKHSFFIDALNLGITLIEAGHFHTENPFCDFLKKQLHEQFPQIPVFIAENSSDFCEYI